MKITRKQLRKIILEAVTTYRSPMQKALDKERQAQRDRLHSDSEIAYQRGFKYGSKFFKEPFVDFNTGLVDYDAIETVAGRMLKLDQRPIEFQEGFYDVFDQYADSIIQEQP
mgnify:CR=1 FL=1